LSQLHGNLQGRVKWLSVTRQEGGTELCSHTQDLEQNTRVVCNFRLSRQYEGAAVGENIGCALFPDENLTLKALPRRDRRQRGRQADGRFVARCRLLILRRRLLVLSGLALLAAR
jgi:hypothetical protein